MRIPVALSILCLLVAAGSIVTVADAAVQQLPVYAAAPGDTPILRSTEHHDGSRTIEVLLPSVAIEASTIAGETFHALTIPGGTVVGDEGRPGLPVFGRLVAVPNGYTVTARIVDVQEQVFSGYRVLPVQPDGMLNYPPGDTSTDAPDNAAAFVIDRAAYAAGAATEPYSVTAGAPGILHGQHVAPVVFQPVRYDPATDELRIAGRLEVELRFERSNAAPAPARQHDYLPESFDRFLRSAVVGYERSDDVTVGPGSYLIICPNNADVIDALQPLVEWRQRQGYHVTLAHTGQTGSNTTSIKAYILNYYETEPVPLEYVVLAGDASGNVTIPTFRENVSGYHGEGDHYYTNLEGDDTLADVHIGRLTCRSSTELQSIVSKILDYETNPPLADSGWFTRACATGDPSYSGITTVYVNQWLKAQLEYRGYTQVDTIFSGNFPILMTNSINQGLTVFGYRGFGGMSNFSTGHIGALSNGGKLPFAVLLTCDTGSFYSDVNARSEAFLRNINGGAIGAIGTATGGTHTRYNNCMYQGIWEGMINGDDHHLGAALARGKLAMYNNYQLSQPVTVESWSVWNNLMGDPATDMWMNYPLAIDATYPTLLPVGVSAVPVEVSYGGLPVVEARVCLFKEGEFQVTGYTDESGRVVLPVSGLSEGTVLVTVTGHDLLPHRRHLDIGSVSQFVALDEYAVDDDMAGSSSGNGDGVVNPGETLELAVALAGLGSSDVFGITGTLTSADYRVTIVDGSAVFGDIPSGQSVWNADELVVSVAADTPDGHTLPIEVTASDGAANWTSLIELAVQSAAFVHEGQTWSGDGESLDPGESGDLTLTIRNTGSLTATGIRATLTTSSPWITITDDDGTFGTVDPGVSGDNGSDPFSLDIDTDCFAGHLATFLLSLQYDGAQSSVEFTLPVGTASTTDPLGPDAYGYYAFDDTDTGYLYAPIYAWVEIDPNHGGDGTAAGLSDFGYEQDDTVVLPLPFTFRYYGQPYDEVSICSNGWLAMGSTSLRHYRNFSIPSAGTPRNLIAVFWDDLHQSGTNQVYYWHDTANQRFIVQWSRMTNIYGAMQNCQVILHDPFAYPTETGDGEILCQYDTVHNNDATNGFATVGIQNFDRSDGVLYTYWNQYGAAAAGLAAGRAILFRPLDILQPTCEPDPTSFDVVVPVDGQDTRTLQLHNNGDPGSVLVYSLDLTDPALDAPVPGGQIPGEPTPDGRMPDGRMPGGQPVGDGAKNLTGSYLTADPVEFWPGDTIDVQIGAHCISSDDEWIIQVDMDFPTGVTINSATGMTGSTAFSYTGSYGDGAQATWDGGILSHGMVGLATLNLTFAQDISDVSVPYLLTGDNWGGPPHSVSDEIVFTVLGPRVSVLAPDGGERWGLGEEHAIEFAASGGPQQVKIELQRQDGGPWETLAESIEASLGSFLWEVTGPISAHCRARVSDVGDPSVTDTSNEEFTIRNSLLWLDLDNWSGYALPGEPAAIELTIDASGMAEGVYAADIVVYSNADDPVVVPLSLTVGDPSAVPLATTLVLRQNRPNPFNPQTEIRFDMPAAGPVRVEVFDLLGHKIRTLLDEELAAGRHAVVWSGVDDAGQPVASGQYFCRLTAGERVLNLKMTVLK